MPSNAFDDLPPVNVLPTPQQPAPAGKTNAFDDLTPPIKSAPEKPPVTAADRVQATEGGILRGTAYLAGAIPDAAANLYNLGKAGLGAAYQGITGKPGWDVGNPNPVSNWIIRQMDKSPLTTTQPNRPDDAPSRYLATAGSVVPGVLAGGGSIPQIAANTARAAVPAMAGQAVGEARPFQSDWANNAAAIGTQLLAGALMPRGRGAPLPENQKLNEAVQQGQQAGYEFPPATTNPTAGNKIVETIAGKVSTQQHASINNQGVTNEGFRADLRLPESTGPITDVEIAQAKANAAPGYDALREAGTIQVKPSFAQKLASALSKNTGASRLAPSLGDSKLENVIGELQKTQSFDAGDAMDTMAILRDKAGEAFRSGNSNTGKAYRAASNAIEEAIDQDLSSRTAGRQGGIPPLPGDPGTLLENYRDSRRQFAQIATYEDALDPSGNVNAGKLAKALAAGEPLSGRARIAAQAASQAPKAFAVPTSSPVNHLGLWGSLGAGALAAHEYLPDHMGLGAALGAAAIPFTRWGARRYALGLGQSNALPTAGAPIAPGVVAGSYTGLAGRTP